jgi:hypothetical protein
MAKHYSLQYRYCNNLLPKWFLDICTSETLTKINNNRLKTHDKTSFLCSVHGEYFSYVNDVLCVGRPICPQCGRINQAGKLSVNRRKNNPFPQWFLDLCTPDTLNKINNNQLRSRDKTSFLCSVHGEYVTRVADVLYHKNSQCPKCGQDKRSFSRSLTERGKFPLSSSFLGKCTPETLEKVTNNKLFVNYKETFLCPVHGVYSAWVNDVLNKDTGCPLCNSSWSNHRSLFERELCDLISDNNIEVIANKKVLDSEYEVDIYLPEKKIGFEVNGYYFHHSGIADGLLYTKSSVYHRNKTDLALKKGIKLYHLWDDTSVIKRDILKSVVLSKLNLTERLYARKFIVKRLSNDEVNRFLMLNHFEGFVQSSYHFALVDDMNNIYSLLSLRHKSVGVVENARFCSLLNYTVVGAFSRLLKYAVAVLKEKGYTEMISYCNRDFSPVYFDTLYYKHNFLFIGDSGSSMVYFCSKTQSLLTDEILHSGVVYSRQKFQKHKLSSLFPDVDLSLTEQQILSQHGIYPCYNSGNFKFKLDFG